ncbi:gfo/Idh/MocA family oxidoreductase [Pontibacter diazotrophicus]|uniref:Gfo/Idh/MocA family oxidoreductase n=1 Tax=Pontibacter diazotrophicus TaxID=1400979 RepID=A0A3D8LAT2_9BACT|nr:Gfo/Idh/MocA family oxidoreductase [Pontibacter diazotrophicus]RDV14490.1 gfo/Idh/MocA family oxidoreductase [Pontibacter diazotrophicus]
MYPLPINRRNFLKGATATLALTALGAHGISLADPAKALRVGLIGTGWYGKSDLFRLMQVAPVEVVALCDVDKNMLDEAAALVSQRLKARKKPRLYEDYQKMLAENKLDIVLIGTPDHWHALPTIAALKAGAHVYVQKPISVDVLEGEAMVAAARKYNRVVQVGTQRRSTPHLIEAKKNIIDAGLLGKVSHVEMYCYYHMRSTANPPDKPVPDFLNYNLWTGPAPLRPYDGLPHRRWRNFMEYSNGIVGDMCIHMFDAARWMLQLGWPKRVSSTGGIYVQKEGAANTSDTQTATFEYDELNCIWQHRTWGTPANPDYPWGLTIYGEKGTLLASPHQYDFIPVDEDGEKIHRDAVYEREKYPEDLKEEGIELHAAPATRLHMQDFLAAIEKGSKPVADIEQGHISTASCILANLSMQLGRPLVYDPVKREIAGDPEATALLQRPYRQPWVHPDQDKV